MHMGAFFVWENFQLIFGFFSVSAAMNVSIEIGSHKPIFLEKRCLGISLPRKVQ